jgi:hypothetical protein
LSKLLTSYNRLLARLYGYSLGRPDIAEEVLNGNDPVLLAPGQLRLDDDSNGRVAHDNSLAHGVDGGNGRRRADRATGEQRSVEQLD